MVGLLSGGAVAVGGLPASGLLRNERVSSPADFDEREYLTGWNSCWFTEGVCLGIQSEAETKLGVRRREVLRMQARPRCVATQG